VVLFFMAEKHYHLCLIRDYSCNNATGFYKYFTNVECQAPRPS
jgi:hypothetical protein